MMVMLPGVVYRFTLSVSIWLFLPSVMYEVVTRGLTEPIDFCQQSRNCKNLIKVVGNFDYSCWRNNPYIIQNVQCRRKRPYQIRASLPVKKKLLAWLLCMKDSTISLVTFRCFQRTKTNCWVKKIGKMSLLASSLLPVLLC